MAALIKDRNTGHVECLYWDIPAKTNKIFFFGAQVAIGADGFAVPAAATAGLKTIGVCHNHTDSTGIADGGILVRVAFRRAMLMNNSSVNADKLTAADLWLPCYVEDDQTVRQINGGTNIVAGIFARFEGTQCLVFYPCGVPVIDT